MVNEEAGAGLLKGVDMAKQQEDRMVSNRGRKRLVTRPPVKRELIVNVLRDQIVQGVLQPGSRLPTRPELQETYDVSQPTIQQAINQLVEEGFLYARGGQGTFVSETPPHLNHYVVVFSHHPQMSTEVWSQFCRALANEASSLTFGGTRRMSVVYRVAQGTAEYDELLSDVKCHRVAGLILPESPNPIIDSPLVSEPGVPVVAITNESAKGIPAVYPDWDNWLTRALDYVAQRGRKRVALLTTWMAESLESGSGSFFGEIRKRGLETRPYWIQHIHPSSASWANNVAQLLFNPEQSVRPDALLINDDNLVEHASAGLVMGQVRVSDEVDVVAHCNFPWQPPTVLPLKRLGFSTRELLATCVKIIDDMRAGEEVKPVNLMPAVFEDEFQRAQSR